MFSYYSRFEACQQPGCDSLGSNIAKAILFRPAVKTGLNWKPWFKCRDFLWVSLRPLQRYDSQWSRWALGKVLDKGSTKNYLRGVLWHSPTLV